mmetsp:Transcript_49968/g.144943  ORF Transcript_49968/g.144943 Transcript_49968/m.144943 type:complete len:297 (+) Transcript_49968:72-962(+)
MRPEAHSLASRCGRELLKGAPSCLPDRVVLVFKSLLEDCKDVEIVLLSDIGQGQSRRAPHEEVGVLRAGLELREGFRAAPGRQGGQRLHGGLPHEGLRILEAAVEQCEGLLGAALRNGAHGPHGLRSHGGVGMAQAAEEPRDGGCVAPLGELGERLQHGAGDLRLVLQAVAQAPNSLGVPRPRHFGNGTCSCLPDIAIVAKQEFKETPQSCRVVRRNNPLHGKGCGLPDKLIAVLKPRADEINCCAAAFQAQQGKITQCSHLLVQASTLQRLRGCLQCQDHSQGQRYIARLAVCSK